MRTKLWTFPILLVMISLVGCGSGRPPGASVKGTVKLDGKPLQAGAVYIENDKGQNDSGPISTSGEFVVANAPLGAAKIRIILPNVPDTPTLPANMPEVPRPKDAPTPGAPKDSLSKEAISQIKSVPAKYLDTKTSGLTTTVSSKNPQLDLTLTTEAQ
jgi:hypothetical protein